MEAHTRVLYVESFPLDTQEAQLKELFSNFGHVNKLELPTFSSKHALCHNSKRLLSRGYAFIEFSSELESNKALRFFNDINNILYMHQLQQQANSADNHNINSDATQTPNPFPEMNLTQEQIRNLSLLRVMRKDVYLNLSQRYGKQRYLSQIRAAKLLVV